MLLNLKVSAMSSKLRLVNINTIQYGEIDKKNAIFEAVKKKSFHQTLVYSTNRAFCSTLRAIICIGIMGYPFIYSALFYF